ncbi:hypothetical protein JVT61DRAFT_9998 [Boletus reticuloceps]|uniref:Uncharacterized protein n=1 Tax=Boletus reticuloceps TaxID=495285 RepID=A0A8I2YZM3_9AGAM|nr:hypothetical protein JVT61DRAFT_9998 [Boletus reticuloceps]
MRSFAGNQPLSEASRDAPRQLPDDIYNATLPRWRAVIRNHLLKAVARESIVIARLQASTCMGSIQLG